MPASSARFLLPLLLVGCAGRTIPGPAIPPGTSSYTWQANSGTVKGTGFQYCDDVEKYTRASAQKLGTLGWTFSILGVGSAATPAVIAATSGDNLSTGEKALTVGLPVASALFAAAALASFTRAEHSNGVAKEASLAMNEEDDSVAARRCTSAIADWNGFRSDSNEAAKARAKSEAEKQKNVAPPGNAPQGAAPALPIIAPERAAPHEAAPNPGAP